MPSPATLPHTTHCPPPSNLNLVPAWTSDAQSLQAAGLSHTRQRPRFGEILILPSYQSRVTLRPRKLALHPPCAYLHPDLALPIPYLPEAHSQACLTLPAPFLPSLLP